MIEIAGLCKKFESSTGRVTALQYINLNVVAGERLGLFGPSGSGKTTLLRCISGLEAPEEGTIRIAGVEVFDASHGLNLAPWMRPIGFVFQDFALWPHMRVVDNVMFPLRHGRSNSLGRTEQRNAALGALRMVEMEEFAERFPAEISGGQRQRVAIARALVSRPSVLLMDEPLSSLDPHLRKQTRDELVNLLERTGITTVFVSHDHVDGLFMTHRIGVMRQGRLVQTGTPADVCMQPSDASVAETLDVGSVFTCRREPLENGMEDRYLIVDSDQSLVLPADAGRGGSGNYHLLIRRDACHIWKGGAPSGLRQRLAGKVVREGYTGRGWCVLVDIAGVSLEVFEGQRPGLRHGDPVEVGVDMVRVQLLPAAA